LPSQRQLKWAQLRVGITVLIASITLAVLIFLMTGSTGLFTKKVDLRAYFDNTTGLRVGAPVRLHGVDIGNVTGIRVVPERKTTPVEVTMRVSSRYLFNLRKDSIITLKTAGVLGEVFADIDSTRAKGPEVQNNDELAVSEAPDFEDVVRSTQGTLVNLQVLLKRADRILTFVETGEGTLGKFIRDPGLYNELNATVKDFQKIVAGINQGEGTIGKLVKDDQLYRKANASIDKLNGLIDQVNEGQGTLGKFIKDPSLYNNANQTIARANRMLDDINSGRGTIGKLAKDEELAAKIDNTVTKLSALADKMEAGQGTAGRFFADPSLYNNTNAMIVETRNLVQSIRENPKKYLTIRFRLF